MKKAVLIFTAAVLFSSCLKNRSDEIAEDKFEFAEEKTPLSLQFKQKTKFHKKKEWRI